MIRPPAFLLALVLVAGCDLVGADTSRFVGTWEGRSVWETTVTSTAYQSYAGTEPGVRGVGVITVSGPIETSLRYFEAFGQTQVQMAGSNAFSAFLQAGGGSHIAKRTANPDEEQLYTLPGLAFTVDGESVTVPPTTVQTDDGPLTLGGTLAGRPLELQPGVPTTLPWRDAFFGQDRLTVAEDGTYRRVGFNGDMKAGTWEVDGEALVLTPTGEGSVQTFTLVDGELVRPGLEARPVDTYEIEQRRRLPYGSLASASQSTLVVYTPAD